MAGEIANLVGGGLVGGGLVGGGLHGGGSLVDGGYSMIAGRNGRMEAKTARDHGIEAP